MRKSKKTPVSTFKRARIVFFVYLFVFIILIGRLVQLQLVKSGSFRELSQNQTERLVKITPERGDIFDRNGKLLAFDMKLKSIYANPNEIKDVWETAEVLQPYLEVQLEEIATALDKQKYFVWLRRKASNELTNNIKELKLRGIYFLNENKRYYLSSEMFSTVIGFVGDDNIGLEGIERHFNSALSGEEGTFNISFDGIRRCSKIFEKPIEPTRNGKDIYLTIDSSIQYFTYITIEKYVKKYNAKRGMVIVMKPSTGEILAMVNYPSFDSNNFSSTSKKFWKNSCIIDSFEPGSTFKVITAAALLESNKVNFSKKVYCENGEYTCMGRTIKDVKEHKYLTFEEILINSSNIGMVKVSENLDRKFFYALILKFGFGNRTEIEYPGEIKGLLRTDREWSKSSMLALPIGYELSVTPIRIVTAYAAIANNGIMMKPIIVSKIKNPESGEVTATVPEKIRRVISEETAKKLKDIMEKVVIEGTGKPAKIEGLSVCGKTGTASKFTNELNQYSKELYLSSFIGFFPKTDPSFVIG
ncbi:MAG: penicillin-binding protein 2, partial [bacterium]|nr:penicillin-binding protein 2 [bacterium]